MHDRISRTRHPKASTMSTTAELAATRSFFGPRAAGWEDRFPDDEPAYRRMVAELAPPPGGRALDAGCGTGRALPHLRAAVGPAGVATGVDATPQMLAEAARRGRATAASLLLADVASLPFRAAAFDAVVAAGLLPHLGDPVTVLRELARVTAEGGRLAVFHPVGRAPLAARHGRTPSDQDVTAPARLRGLLAASGWSLATVDDGTERYLAIAVRRPG
jgi:SAM-dependent methyltransferase